MTFLNDLSKTLTQAGQAAVQKTKEVADYTKANAKILDIQNKLDKAYAEVGRKYTKLYPGNDEDEMRETVEAVYALEDQLHLLKNELNDLKGVVECPKCGAICSDEAAYCEKCGAELVKNEIIIDVE